MNTKGCMVAEMLMQAFKIINAQIQIIKYTDPEWKLYIVCKSIYFDDKLIFGVNFLVIESSMPYWCLWRKYWMKIRNCIIFMNNSVERGQNENF